MLYVTKEMDCCFSMVCSENCLFIATGSTARGRNSRKVKYPIKIKAMLKEGPSSYRDI